MLRDPYRQMFLVGSAVSSSQAALSGLDPVCEVLMESLKIGSGTRLLLAGLMAPEILPKLRNKLGLTGQLVIVDPSLERLSMVSSYDAQWAVILRSPASSIPNMDSTIDVVLCWSSFLDLDHHYIQTIGEFFRVLAPGGRVLIAHNGPMPPAGPPRPCPAGLGRLFIEAGFSRLSAEETEELFLFKAEKVAGFDKPLDKIGWA
jgi:SAM-dependent methyltransferase